MKQLLRTLIVVYAFLWVPCSMAAETVSPPETFGAVLVKPLATADVLIVKRDDGVELSVRLLGVACPQAPQPFARQAQDYLMQEFKDVPLRIEIIATDRSQLPVAWVHTEEKRSVNEQLLRGGFGWWDEPNMPKDKRLKKWTAEALLAETGLWQHSAPLAPWDYRASHRIPPVVYELPTEPVIVETETARSEIPTLAAKGTARPSVRVSVAPEDYLALAAKHKPRIQRDGQGNAMGLTASDIGSIPGAREIGFKNGDIVRSVNGIAITNEAQIFGLVDQLRGAKQIKLQVIRNGGPITITIPL